jgi:YggT family protein
MAVLAEILTVLSQTLGIYFLVLFVRLVLSWFPNLDWGNPILSAISSITDPFLNVFRGFIPPIGGFDISSVLALVSIQLLQGLIDTSRGLLA